MLNLISLFIFTNVFLLIYTLINQGSKFHFLLYKIDLYIYAVICNLNEKKNILSQFLHILDKLCNILGDIKTIYSIQTIIAIYFLRQKKYNDIFLLIIPLFLTTCITYVLKNIVSRHRPIFIEEYFCFNLLNNYSKYYHSLPSGHVSLTTSIIISMFFIYKKSYVYIFGNILLILMIIGRIYSKQHWLSDTILGLYIGIAAAILVFSIVKKYIIKF